MSLSIDLSHSTTAVYDLFQPHASAATLASPRSQFTSLLSTLPRTPQEVASIEILKKPASERTPIEHHTVHTWLTQAHPRLFSEFSRTLIKDIISRLEYHAYPKKAIVFEQDDPPDCMYLLIRGSVTLWKVNVEKEKEKEGGDGTTAGKQPTSESDEKFLNSSVPMSPRRRRAGGVTSPLHGVSRAVTRRGSQEELTSAATSDSQQSSPSTTTTSSNLAPTSSRSSLRLSMRNNGVDKRVVNGIMHTTAATAATSRRASNLTLDVTATTSDTTTTTTSSTTTTATTDLSSPSNPLYLASRPSHREARDLLSDPPVISSHLLTLAHNNGLESWQVKYELLGTLRAHGEKVVLGETGLLQAQPRSATVRCEELTEFLTLSKLDFDSLMCQKSYLSDMNEKYLKLCQIQLFQAGALKGTKYVSLKEKRRRQEMVARLQQQQQQESSSTSNTQHTSSMPMLTRSSSMLLLNGNTLLDGSSSSTANLYTTATDDKNDQPMSSSASTTSFGGELMTGSTSTTSLLLSPSLSTSHLTPPSSTLAPLPLPLDLSNSLKKLALYFEIRHIPARTLIVQQHSLATFVYAIVQGEVEVLHTLVPIQGVMGLEGGKEDGGGRREEKQQHHEEKQSSSSSLSSSSTSTSSFLTSQQSLSRSTSKKILLLSHHQIPTYLPQHTETLSGRHAGGYGATSKREVRRDHGAHLASVTAATASSASAASSKARRSTLDSIGSGNSTSSTIPLPSTSTTPPSTVLLCSLSSGQTFGELDHLPSFGNGRHPFGLRSVTPCTMLVMSREDWTKRVLGYSNSGGGSAAAASVSATTPVTNGSNSDNATSTSGSTSTPTSTTTSNSGGSSSLLDRSTIRKLKARDHWRQQRALQLNQRGEPLNIVLQAGCTWKQGKFRHVRSSGEREEEEKMKEGMNGSGGGGKKRKKANLALLAKQHLPAHHASVLPSLHVTHDPSGQTGWKSVRGVDEVVADEHGEIVVKVQEEKRMSNGTKTEDESKHLKYQAPSDDTLYNFVADFCSLPPRKSEQSSTSSRASTTMTQTKDVVSATSTTKQQESQQQQQQQQQQQYVLPNPITERRMREAGRGVVMNVSLGGSLSARSALSSRPTTTMSSTSSLQSSPSLSSLHTSIAPLTATLAIGRALCASKSLAELESDRALHTQEQQHHHHRTQQQHVVTNAASAMKKMNVNPAKSQYAVGVYHATAPLSQSLRAKRYKGVYELNATAVPTPTATNSLSSASSSSSNSSIPASLAHLLTPPRVPLIYQLQHNEVEKLPEPFQVEE